MEHLAIFVSFAAIGLLSGFIAGLIIGVLIGKTFVQKTEEPEVEKPKVRYVTNTQTGGILKITEPLSPLEQKWIDTKVWKFIR